MARALTEWRRQWLARTTGHHYGVFRILFVGGFFLAPFLLPLQATRVDVQRALSAGTEPYTHPVLLLRLIHLPLSADASLGWLMVGRALTATIGIATRLSLVGVAVLHLYLGSTANSYGFIAHDTTVPAIVLIVLAACPGVSPPCRSTPGCGRAGDRTPTGPAIVPACPSGRPAWCW